MPITVAARSAAELESAVDAFARTPTGGLLVLPDVTNLIHRDQIIALAARHRLPAVYPYRYYAASGGLLSYGSEQADVFRRAVCRQSISDSWLGNLRECLAHLV